MTSGTPPVAAATPPHHVAIAITSLDPGSGFGDWHTGHELGDALRDLGCRVTYVERADGGWYVLPADVTAIIALLDSFDARRIRPGVARVAWVRNWADRWVQRPGFDEFDIVLASSAAAKRRIDRVRPTPAIVFPIATNPTRFAAAGRASPGNRGDVVFTGNRWGVERTIERGLARLAADGVQLAIYGRGWEDAPALAAVCRGPRPYDELPAIYRGARLVVDDAAVSAAPYGSVNSRVFDALATGTLVITDNELGVRELFDVDFPVWSDPASLSALVGELLADDVRRTALAARYQRTVLDHHTYRRRAEDLHAILRDWQRAAPPQGGPPSSGGQSTTRNGGPEVTGSTKHPNRRRRLRPAIVVAGGGLAVGVAVGLATAIAAGLGLTASASIAPAAIVAAAAAASTTTAALVAVARVNRQAQARQATLHAATTASLAEIRGELRALRRDLPAIAGLAPLGEGYPLPIGGDFPMAPDALAMLARLVAERRPRVIVEAGSGVSSLVAGLTIRRTGVGRVISLDHDAAWASETRRRVAALDLADLVEVVHAPLRRQDFGGEARSWYDIPAGSLPDGEVDLLVVDGPPASIDPTGLARWPALPALSSRLGPEAVVFVDDAARAGERAMVQRWLAEIPGWRAVTFPTERGTAILERDRGPIAAGPTPPVAASSP